MTGMAKIQADFDRLAQFSTDDWDHNNHYHDFLLKHLPVQFDSTLEIGCGTGLFSRHLAQRAQNVLALDLSPEMIRLAQERSPNYPNIAYEVSDILQRDLPAAHYDCIASIATLHHLSMPDLLPKLKQALKSGGTLLVLDLVQGQLNFSNLAPNIAAVVMSMGYKLVKNGHTHDSPEVQAAWEAHGKDDVYLTMEELRRICAEHLPDAQLRTHLFWRYSLVWKKP